jgi:hypothetical protein
MNHVLMQTVSIFHQALAAPCHGLHKLDPCSTHALLDASIDRAKRGYFQSGCFQSVNANFGKVGRHKKLWIQIASHIFDAVC